MLKFLPLFLLLVSLPPMFDKCGKGKQPPPNDPPPTASPLPTVEPTPVIEPSPQPTATPAASPTPDPIVMPTPPVGVLNPGPAPTPFPAEVQAEVSSGDLGAAINEAQKRAGVKEIVVTKSGRLETPVILLPGMRLRLNGGVVVTTHTSEIPIRLKEGASIIGAGMAKSTIVESSVKGQWNVVAGFYGTDSNGAPDFDILLYSFEVRGTPERDKDWNSAPQAVALGNCKRCRAEALWINGTHSIGLQVGGGGLHFAPDGAKREYAEAVAVIHCRFTRVASQPLALVNGQDIEFAFNWIEKSGQLGGPGSHPIDLEINQREDRLQRIRIHHNWIDSREAEVFGNGIIVQAGEQIEEIDDIIVEHNVLIGGVLKPATNNMSSGIMIFGPTMKHVTVRFNRIWRTGHGCFTVNGMGLVITDNECVDTGGGGIPGATASHVRSSSSRASEISRNTYKFLGDGSASSTLFIVNSPELVLGENPGFGIDRKQ